MTTIAKSTVYGIVLAGGVGERLWPLSRQSRPKQFLKLGSEKTLLEQSIDRLQGVVDKVWVVTSNNHYDLVKQEVGNLVDYVLAEPCGRNTAPAILYSCLELQKVDPDALVVFMPSDPYIPLSDYKKFRNYLHKALMYAHRFDQMVLLGVEPTYAATGYGYIEYDSSPNQSDIFAINRFHEKPSLRLAQNYIKQSNMLWNIGMFCGNLQFFIKQYQSFAPDIYKAVCDFMKNEKFYEEIESISIDYAVIEKSNKVSVQPVDFAWCDVGNVDVFLSIKQQESKMSKAIEINARDNLVDVPGKLVALVGVSDLCVVETEDALLITKRSEAEKVRAVVAQLKQEKQTSYL